MWENHFDVAADEAADAEFTMGKALYHRCDPMEKRFICCDMLRITNMTRGFEPEAQ